MANTLLAVIKIDQFVFSRKLILQTIHLDHSNGNSKASNCLMRSRCLQLPSVWVLTSKAKKLIDCFLLVKIEDCLSMMFINQKVILSFLLQDTLKLSKKLSHPVAFGTQRKILKKGYCLQLMMSIK
jgi:hypothetical protein